MAVRRLTPADPRDALEQAARDVADLEAKLAQARLRLELLKIEAMVQAQAPGSRGLVTVPQAAEVLGISQASVWRLVESGELPSQKFGRSRRVNLSKLNTD